MFTILKEKNPCPVLTAENVLAELEKAGFTINFYNGTSLSDIDLGTFDAKTNRARLDKDLPADKIASELSAKDYASAGLLSLGRRLIENPSIIDDAALCVQNAERDSKGNFVYVVMLRWDGEDHLHVNRDGDVWDEGDLFLFRPQD